MKRISLHIGTSKLYEIDEKQLYQKEYNNVENDI